MQSKPSKDVLTALQPLDQLALTPSNDQLQSEKRSLSNLKNRKIIHQQEENSKNQPVVIIKKH